MTRQRVLLYGLLLVVAGAAAVLSFSALRDLALVCGFDARLAWLLPVVVDAGAAAGSLAWLGSAAPTARGYGRALALILLASSVGGNALGHGLQAYGQRPHWLVVVGVSAIAPAVLGALVHLVVLVGRVASPAVLQPPAPARVSPPVQASAPNVKREVAQVTTVETREETQERLLREGAGRVRLQAELGISEWEARQLLSSRRGDAPSGQGEAGGA